MTGLAHISSDGKNEKSMIRTQVFSVQHKTSIPHNRIILQEFFSRLLSYSIAGILSWSCCAIRELGFSSSGCPTGGWKPSILIIEYEKTLPLEGGELDSDVSWEVSVQRRNGVL